MSTHRLAAIMFADIVGYTAMMQRNEAEGMAKAKQFRKLLQDLVPQYNGQLLEIRGDGSLSTFNSAVDAVRCAQKIQESLRLELPLRIGIHLGDIVQNEDHIYGDAVNIASRIESIGIAGAILVSSNIRNQIKNKPEFKLISLGQFAFKNVEEEMGVYALANKGLTIPKQHELPSTSNREKAERNKDARYLVRGMIMGFIGLIVGMSIWVGISWKDNSKAPASMPSVAVMPFTDMSPDKDQAYLGDGMAEEIINLLTQLPQLKVTSRSSSFSFRDQNIDLLTIAEKLDVEHILQGSIRDNGETVKISVHLIEANLDQSIWSNTWERKIDDVFNIQEAIAKEIVQVLKVNSYTSKLEAPKISPNAYRLYLKAHYQIEQRNFKKAREHILQSISVDSLYAPAWATLGKIDNQFASVGVSPTSLQTYSEMHELAKRHARKGVELGPEMGMTHAVLGVIYQFAFGKADSSEFHLQKALELTPGDANTLSTVGLGKIMRGDHLTSLTLLEKAEALDPMSSEIYFYKGMAHHFSKQYALAKANYRKTIEITPASSFAYSQLAWCLLEEGKLEEAETYASQERSFGLREAVQAVIAWEKKDPKAADAHLENLTKRAFRSSAYQIAQVYAHRGNIDKAFGWLERSFEQYDPGTHFTPFDIAFTNLHDDPRWKPFLEKIR